MPISCFEEQVAKAAAWHSGGVGPCGIERLMLQNWLLRNKGSSEWLQEEMACWVCLLSNSSPPYVAYRGLNTV
jgi:hypothetical protein